MSSFTLPGLVAAPFTPFRPDGSLNLDAVPRYAALLTAQGVRGAFVNGTTGEGASLTTEERKRVAEAWRRAAPASLAIVVHVGHNAVGDSVDLARHAAAIGCDAIAALAPSFFKPAGAAGLVDYCTTLAAAAPALPFYYYHMPSMTGFDCRVAEFLAQAQERIPSLAGVKFTHEDLLDFGLCRQVGGGRYDILYGRDETLLCGLALGATGAVGSTYNYAARIYLEVMAAFERGDLVAARTAQFRAQRFIGTLIKYGGGVVGGKALMVLCGLDCGPVRSPLAGVPPAALAAFERELRAGGFFDFAARAA
jgi:N-acetylneuraminate lyase